jgi:hypothetical protein
MSDNLKVSLLVILMSLGITNHVFGVTTYESKVATILDKAFFGDVNALRQAIDDTEIESFVKGREVLGLVHVALQTSPFRAELSAPDIF